MIQIDGRALTTDGALSTAAITATTHSARAHTPLSWLYFRGNPAVKNVLLEWETTNEINNGFFTIEKSRDGVTFETLTTINATAGPQTRHAIIPLQISSHTTLAYYRISQTDQDGRKNYYQTILVKVNVTPGLNVLHYVQRNYLYVQVSGAVPANGSIELYGIDGKKIISQNIMLTKESSTYKIDKPLHKGIYLINIVSQGEKLYTEKCWCYKLNFISVCSFRTVWLASPL